jgi:hypothetical protein
LTTSKRWKKTIGKVERDCAICGVHVVEEELLGCIDSARSGDMTEKTVHRIFSVDRQWPARNDSDIDYSQMIEYKSSRFSSLVNQ